MWFPPVGSSPLKVISLDVMTVKITAKSDLITIGRYIYLADTTSPSVRFLRLP
jgi:hypothetical protein